MWARNLPAGVHLSPKVVNRDIIPLSHWFISIYEIMLYVHRHLVQHINFSQLPIAINCYVAPQNFSSAKGHNPTSTILYRVTLFFVIMFDVMMVHQHTAYMYIYTCMHYTYMHYTYMYTHMKLGRIPNILYYTCLFLL